MQQPAAPPSTLQALTFPCLSLAAAASGLAFPRACAPLGSLPALQAACHRALTPEQRAFAQCSFRGLFEAANGNAASWQWAA